MYQIVRDAIIWKPYLKWDELRENLFNPPSSVWRCLAVMPRHMFKLVKEIMERITSWFD